MPEVAPPSVDMAKLQTAATGTALHFDCQRRQSFDFLKKSGVRAVKENDVVRAIKDNDVEFMNSIIKDSGIHGWGSNILALSIKLDRLEVAQLLLEAGYDPNTMEPDGTTSLYWAETADAALLLTRYGAKVSVEAPDDGYTSLHRASEKGLYNVVKVMLEADPNAPIESFDYIDRTPLACAAEKNRLEAMSVLLACGANVNGVRPIYGHTPLQLALEGGHLRAAEVLLRAGSDPYLSEGITTSPQDLAQKRGLLKELSSFFGL